MKKKILAILLSGMIFSGNVTVFAGSEDLLYSEKEVQTITDGLTYEKSSRLYKAGWMDVYVLTADMKNDNIDFRVIDSVTEHGLKKSVTDFAKENGVVAGVNGDFFGSGNPQSSMGQVARDGEMVEVKNYYNGNENKYAGFFIDKEGRAFIDYVKSTFGFYNSANPVITVNSKNKAGNYSSPVYFDREGITSTADMDKRVKGLYKIVVEGENITQITNSTVTVPENGYIIVMDTKTAEEKLSSFSVGQKVSFNENETFVFRPDKSITHIETGISGGGEILRNGQIVSNGLIIGENVRNPRTCIGVNQSKDKVIVLAVDGRRNGIGATHREVAQLLLEYGCYDAIHLDGGGSTALALRKEGETDISLENVPSEGSQRLVANGVGFATTNPTGQLSEISVELTNDDDSRVLSGVDALFEVKGFDENHNPVSVNSGDVTLSVVGVEATVSGLKVNASTEGSAVITAQYNGLKAETQVDFLAKPTNLSLVSSKSYLDINESVEIKASLINNEGYGMNIKTEPIEFTVDNPQVGVVENGSFIAKGEGVCTVTGNLNGSLSYISFSVGTKSQFVTGFESNNSDLYMSYYPTTGITGGGGYYNKDKHEGNNSLLLNYNFSPDLTTTQACYVCLHTPITLGGNPTKVGMWVKGDTSTNLLKMEIIDNSNTKHNVELIKEMTSDQWQYVEADLPSGLAYPVKIDKFYVAALSTGKDDVKGTVLIDEISSLTPTQLPKTALNTGLNDPMKDLSKLTEGYEEINVFGQTAVREEKDHSKFNDVVYRMTQKADMLVFSGLTNLTNKLSDETPEGFVLRDYTPSDIKTVKWQDKYETTESQYVSVINLASSTGVLRTSSENQWRWLQSYLKDFSKQNIIINLNKTVLSSGGNNLKDSKETALLHKILRDFVYETGKNVIVVSGTNNVPDTVVKEGVRYITLNGLSVKDKNDKSLYKYLKIRANDKEMYYNIEDIYF